MQNNVVLFFLLDSVTAVEETQEPEPGNDYFFLQCPCNACVLVRPN